MLSSTECSSAHFAPPIARCTLCALMLRCRLCPAGQSRCVPQYARWGTLGHCNSSTTNARVASSARGAPWSLAADPACQTRALTSGSDSACHPLPNPPGVCGHWDFLSGSDQTIRVPKQDAVGDGEWQVLETGSKSVEQGPRLIVRRHG